MTIYYKIHKSEFRDYTHIAIIRKTKNIRELYTSLCCSRDSPVHALSSLLCWLLVIHLPVHPIRPRLSSVLPPIFLPGPRLPLKSTGSTHTMRPHAPRLGVCRFLFPLWPFMPPVVPYSVFVPPLAELLLDNPHRVVLLEVPCRSSRHWTYLVRPSLRLR